MTISDRTVTDVLSATAEGLGHRPRVVASGNGAVPWRLLSLVDAALPEYVLHLLNAPTGIPSRDGVVHETCFVGSGMRRSPSRTKPARS